MLRSKYFPKLRHCYGATPQSNPEANDRSLTVLWLELNSVPVRVD